MLAMLLSVILSTAGSFAQGQRSSTSTELSSVKEVKVEARRPDQQGQKCGLAATDLEPPARLALEASSMRLNQSSSSILFVSANSVEAGGVCAVAIDVELFRPASEFRASVSVWRHSAMIAGSRDGLNGRVREKVDTLTREFIAEWMKVRR